MALQTSIAKQISGTVVSRNGRFGKDLHKQIVIPSPMALQPSIAKQISGTIVSRNGRFGKYLHKQISIPSPMALQTSIAKLISGMELLQVSKKEVKWLQISSMTNIEDPEQGIATITSAVAGVSTGMNIKSGQATICIKLASGAICLPFLSKVYNMGFDTLSKSFTVSDNVSL